MSIRNVTHRFSAHTLPAPSDMADDTLFVPQQLQWLGAHWAALMLGLLLLVPILWLRARGSTSQSVANATLVAFSGVAMELAIAGGVARRNQRGAGSSHAH